MDTIDGKKEERQKKEIEDEQIVESLKRIHEENRKVYGAERLQRALENEDISIGLGRIRRLMRENGIYSEASRKRQNNMKRHDEERCSDNDLNREFNVKKPNHKWVGDITYIKTQVGWAYLAVVMDLFNR